MIFFHDGVHIILLCRLVYLVNQHLEEKRKKYILFGVIIVLVLDIKTEKSKIGLSDIVLVLGRKTK